MSLRRRLAAALDAEDPRVIIPQEEGPDAVFRQSDLEGAYLALVDHARATAAGESPPPEHPLNRAARTSTSASWQQSIHGVGLADGPTEDLSEV